MDGERTAHSEGRKIELQSPEDLTYLITNVRRLAAQHINEAFPPAQRVLDGAGAGARDPMQAAIEALVNDVRPLPLHSRPVFCSSLAPWQEPTGRGQKLTRRLHLQTIA